MRKALGRGLDALLPKKGNEDTVAGEKSVHRIPVDSIKPNKSQPRKNFNPEKMSELAQSIKEHGLTNPITVSYDSISNTYELIAGERRLRACKLAGFTHIDAIIKTPTSEKHRLVLAVIENIQRENLNAIEEAVAYRRLMSEFNLSQVQLSQYLGKSKSAISNTMRLLELADDMQKSVQIEQISEGHARALLTVQDPTQRNILFKRIIQQNLSVRDVEALARSSEKRKIYQRKAANKKSPDILAWEQTLQQILGTRVEVRSGKENNKGALIIHFYSLSDFDRIINHIKK